MASNVVHGTLHASLIQATHLLQGLASVTKTVEEIKEVHHEESCHHKFYATIDFGTARVASSRVVEDDPDSPAWNETFHVLCAYTSCEYAVISIEDQLPDRAEVIGRTRIPISEILSGKVIEGSYDLYDEHFSEKLKNAEIQIRLQFSHVTEDPHWGAGIRDIDFAGVENVYFKQKNGCMVTLYQNAHLSRQFRPRTELHGGSLYSPPRLWEEMYDYINGAQVFIYIAGWSVYTELTLVRDRERMIDGAQGVTLGELLKRKADQGVRVLVLIWQDLFGVMQTHCDEAFEYFKDSHVHCVLSPRNSDRPLNVLERLQFLQITHHQKTVSLDAPIEEGSTDLHVVSFVGGIDLTNGRYDTEKHTLFGDLDTVFKDDFLQNNFHGADLRHGGPREPWHDTHSKIEGPAALDVVTNFTERWTNQADPSLLADIHQMTHFVMPDGPEAWNVQIFRSIDDGSIKGFSENQSGLVRIKDQVVEQSIHCAYVQAIRRARNFIYIENQYFFGSCESWNKDQDCGCLHLVPIEIALKIVSKIRAKERFAVYVVTPMWPEGIPEDDILQAIVDLDTTEIKEAMLGETVQAMLHWMRKTIEMMYAMIGEALREEKSTALPTDYLNFFCLGNRETKRPGEYVAPETPKEGTDYWNAQMNRRFLIYVHAKLMIVDDEYVIMGSANLNQRSMDGARDTEIAQGSYQPQHINSEDGSRRARGQIFSYRMSLWYEHFAMQNGGLRHEYLQPENQDCVRMVRGIAEQAWDIFVGEEIIDLPGHLLPFPVGVTKEGKVVALDKHTVFPDTNASIAGCNDALIPPIFTT